MLTGGVIDLRLPGSPEMEALILHTDFVGLAPVGPGQLRSGDYPRGFGAAGGRYAGMVIRR